MAEPPIVTAILILNSTTYSLNNDVLCKTVTPMTRCTCLGGRDKVWMYMDGEAARLRGLAPEILAPE